MRRVDDQPNLARIGLQPHRVKTLVLCVDEKPDSGVDRTQPMLPDYLFDLLITDFARTSRARHRAVLPLAL
jgi:hypothetical protein